MGRIDLSGRRDYPVLIVQGTTSIPPQDAECTYKGF